MTKSTKLPVRPVKTQPWHLPSLIKPSLCAKWKAKDSMLLHADSEDSDQTVQMPRLI